MNDQIQMLPNLSAETIRSWLLQVDKDRGPKNGERAIRQLDDLSSKAEEIITKLEKGEGNKGQLVRRLCELREKRNSGRQHFSLCLCPT